jgi:hypothetical protein
VHQVDKMLSNLRATDVCFRALRARLGRLRHCGCWREEALPAHTADVGALRSRGMIQGDGDRLIVVKSPAGGGIGGQHALYLASALLVLGQGGQDSAFARRKF